MPALPKEIQVQIDKIRAEIRTLTTERENRSLDSISGDAGATARIAAIDKQRTALNLKRETLEAAFRAARRDEQEGALPARIANGWQRHQANLHRAVVQRREDAAVQLFRAVNEANRGGQWSAAEHQYDQLINAPIVIATEMLGGIWPDPVVPYGRMDELFDLKAKQKPLIAAAAARLVQETSLPPMTGEPAEAVRYFENAANVRAQNAAAHDAAHKSLTGRKD